MKSWKPQVWFANVFQGWKSPSCKSKSKSTMNPQKSCSIAAMWSILQEKWTEMMMSMMLTAARSQNIKVGFNTNVTLSPKERAFREFCAENNLRSLSAKFIWLAVGLLAFCRDNFLVMCSIAKQKTHVRYVRYSHLVMILLSQEAWPS